MDNNDFSKKNEMKYKCVLCDFYTSKKTDYKIHLETKKHKKHEIISNNNDFTKKNEKFNCECGKSYKHKPNLYAHKKNCKFEIENKLITYDENNIDYKNMFLQIIEKTDVLQNLIIEQSKIIQEKDKIINEMIPKIGNNNTTTTNSNNKFNICLFLNENCKDALSMDEFVKKIEITVSDLLYTKQKGLVNGISNIFIKNLNDLPEKERPIWCSDKKRKKLFIKESEWKEDIDNLKTKQAIKDISVVQVKNINKYTDENPDWKDKENKKDEYITIVKHVTNEITGKETEIINKITDSIQLDKETLN